MIPKLANRYAIDHTPVVLGERVVIKHCEFCGLLHVTSAAQAKFPGDLLPMQRAAGHRKPVLCTTCEKKTHSLSFEIEQLKEMTRITEELRRDRDIRDARESERLRFRKPREVMHESQQKSASARRARTSWAKWRIPLMEALKTKGELTAKEIAVLMGVKEDAPKHYVYTAPQRARNIGIPIAVVRVEHHIGNGKGNHNVRYFGLSNKPTLENLPPQDSVTHQFMREVQL